VYAQTGTGELAPPAAYLTKQSAGSVTTAALDGDGRLELVVVHGGWQQLTALRVDADGTFSRYYAAPLPYASAYHPQGLALGDFTGDGRPDAAIADYNHGLVRLDNVGGPNPPPGERAWVGDVVPAPGQIDFPVRGAALRVSLSRGIAAASVGRATVGIFDPLTRDWPDPVLDYNATRQDITIIPRTALRPNTTYHLYVYELRDTGGAVNPGLFTSSFRTGAG
jgi:hypothetical protein